MAQVPSRGPVSARGWANRCHHLCSPRLSVRRGGATCSPASCREVPRCPSHPRSLTARTPRADSTRGLMAKKRKPGFSKDPHMMGLVAAVEMMNQNPFSAKMSRKDFTASCMLVAMATAVKHPESVKPFLDRLDSTSYGGAGRSMHALADELAEVFNLSHEVVNDAKGGEITLPIAEVEESKPN